MPVAGGIVRTTVVPIGLRHASPSLRHRRDPAGHLPALDRRCWSCQTWCSSFPAISTLCRPRSNPHSSRFMGSMAQFMFLLPPDSPLTKGQVSRRTLLTDSSHMGPRPSGTPLARGDPPRVVRLKGALIEIRPEGCTYSDRGPDPGVSLWLPSAIMGNGPRVPDQPNGIRR